MVNPAQETTAVVVYYNYLLFINYSNNKFIISLACSVVDEITLCTIMNLLYAQHQLLNVHTYHTKDKEIAELHHIKEEFSKLFLSYICGHYTQT